MQTDRASVGVGVIIHKEDKILLQKRTGFHGAGTWSCPGGHIDFGETLEATAIRETKEEVGIDITNIRFKAITNDIFLQDHKHYITVWVEADYASGTPSVHSVDELTDVGWFSAGQLPQPLFVPLQNFVEGKSYPPNVLR